jgi:hypothetical protein
VSTLPYDMLRVLEENGPHDLDLTPEIEISKKNAGN